MNPIEALLLGLLQGLTEFLPVSSSAHLAFAQQFLDMPAEWRLSYGILLHLGTGLALVIFFARRIVQIVRDWFSPIAVKRKSSGHLTLMIIVGTIPAGIVGLLGHERLELLFTDIRYPALCLLVTGAGLYVTRSCKGDRQALNWRDALIVGCAQALALLPGISRSGATIAAGLFIGLARPRAFEYSFLLSIPAVIGAGLLDLRSSPILATHAIALPVALIGPVISCLAGLVALLVLRRLVLGERFWWFAVYCWALGLAVLAVSASR